MLLRLTYQAAVVGIILTAILSSEIKTRDVCKTCMPPPPLHPLSVTSLYLFSINLCLKHCQPSKGKLYVIVGLPYNDIYSDNFTKNPNLITNITVTNA